MAFPPLDDSRLEALVGTYVLASQRLSLLFDQLLTLPQTERFRVMQSVQFILRGLETDTEQWIARNVPAFFREADAAAVDTLRRAGLGEFLAPQVDEVALEALAQGIRGPLEKARQSIEFQATKVLRSTSLAREFPTLALQAQRQVSLSLSAGEALVQTEQRITLLLRQRFQTNVVSILGSDGKRYRFGLDFYSAMVAQNTRAQAGATAAILRARQTGHDLVRISSQKSLNGDWCDAYRGRVYSLSGESAVYPWVGMIPNGGPPFHPWCRHSMNIFIPAFHSEAQQRAFANTQSRFLMRPNESSPNRIIRAWNDAVRLEGDPAPLRVS